MSLFGDFEHHLQISVGDCIPNSWVMFNWDIYYLPTPVLWIETTCVKNQPFGACGTARKHVEGAVVGFPRNDGDGDVGMISIPQSQSVGIPDQDDVNKLGISIWA